MSSHQIENLNIQGNGDMDAEAAYKYDGVDVLKYSGATINVHVAGGTLDMTNVTSRFGSFALYGYSRANFEAHPAVIINAKDCLLEKSWANNIYAQGFVDITLDSCFVGQANGPAIVYDVRGSEFAQDATLNLLSDTDIQNWVTGQEAWFVGQNLVSKVPQIKTQIEGYVQTFSQKTKSILKEGKMNLAIMMNRKGDTSEWIGGADKLDSTWMQNNADATYRGYLQQNYKGQGALRGGDFGYVGRGAQIYQSSQVLR